MQFNNSFALHVFKIKESIGDIHTKLDLSCGGSMPTRNGGELFYNEYLHMCVLLS